MQKDFRDTQVSITLKSFYLNSMRVTSKGLYLTISYLFFCSPMGRKKRKRPSIEDVKSDTTDLLPTFSDRVVISPEEIAEAKYYFRDGKSSQDPLQGF